ncbi:MAG: hypothetical protein Q7S40_27530 [Opitutaceae bacterium]|nr:hypothetical protein [Opitutaceae bacterium]
MRTRALVGWLVLIGIAQVGRAQPNQIRNPGFEAPPTNARLPGEGWWLYEGRGQPDVSVGRAMARSGGASVRLHATEDVRFALVSPPFAVSPGDELRFEGWVRDDKSVPAASRGNFGLAFRDAAGRVFERAYVPIIATGDGWTQLSGSAKAPANAVRAELHLGYNAPPAIVWIDDVSAVITNPVSMSLVEGAQPWTGRQQITVNVINRRATPLSASVRAVVARQTTEVPVVVAADSSARVKLPIAISGVGAFDYTLSLVEQNAPVCTLTGKFRTTAPLVLYPANPCYHILGQGGGETRFDARIVVNPAQRAGLRLAVVLTDTSGREIETATADASSGDIAGVRLHVPVQAAGVFALRARLLDSADRELGKGDTQVHVAPRSESEVTLGPDGYLRVAGRAHFPIGMYSCGQYETMGRAGFSATHNYGVTTGEAADLINPNDLHLKELLDRSWAAGMRMMVELPRKSIERAQWASIRRRIETFRHHPGLLCWGSEERVARGEAPLANVAALYRLVHELDPQHPLVLGDTREVIGRLQKDRRNFFPDEAMDAGIWWWYPIPLHAPDGNGLDGREPSATLLQPPSWLTTTLSKKPLWIAIQSYQQPRPDARFPTPAEYRCMAYLSIINGVKGLWFYTGSGQRDYQGKPAGLLNKPEEGHWDYVQRLVRELRELEPVLVAPPATARIAISGATPPVEFAVREVSGAMYLLAANKSAVAQTVRFAGRDLAAKKARVLYEDHAVTMNGDALTDSFAPFGVHVYRIE